MLRNIQTATKEFQTVFLPPPDAESKTEVCCTICQEEFEETKEKSQRRVAPVGCAGFPSHHCHDACLKKWERTKTPLKQCPTCRQNYTHVVEVRWEETLGFPMN
jgi:hypothetical protein